MTVLWPQFLLAVLLVPLGIFVAKATADRRRARLAAFLAAGGSATGASRGRAGRLRTAVPAALAVAGFVVLAVALARPQATVALPHIEGTVMLTFDVSGSMAADDVSPSRMDEAKAAAKAIVARQAPGVVIGIVAFSDAGLSVTAPTDDQVAVLASIDRLGPSRGTSVGQGIIAALAAIQQANAPTPPDYYSNRSPDPTPTPPVVGAGNDPAAEIVLLSDGENNERPDPAEAAQAAADAGVRIVALGVGTTAGTTLDLDGFKVHTALDEAQLQSLAATSDGAYYKADDPAGVDAVYDGLARKLVVRDEPIEITALLAALGLGLLVAGAAGSLALSGRLP